MKRLFLTLWIGGWAFGVAYGGFWLLHEGWELMRANWIWCGLAVCVFGIGVVLLGAQLWWITGAVMAGRLDGRLANRAFRNALSDAIMFFKTGIIKW
jgi:hypothetical protein